MEWVADFTGIRIRQQNHVFNYAERRKFPWLMEDLSFLHETPLQLNPTMNLPVINSLGRLVGALYVLEGSTLGGQLISRQLNQHLGLTLNTGARFFTAMANK